MGEQGGIEDEAALMRAILDAIPELVWTTRADGSTDYVSPAWGPLLGVTPSEIPSALRARVHEGDRAAVERAWREGIASGGVIRTVARVRVADGTDRTLAGVAVPVRDASGRVARWVSTSTDITDRERAAAALRASEGRLASILDGLACAVLSTDSEGRVVSWNGAASRLFGYPPDAVRPPMWPDPAHPVAFATLAQVALTHDQTPHARVLRGDPVQSLELRVRGPSGVERVLSFDGGRVDGPAGEPLTLVTAVDVSARHAADAAAELDRARLRVATSVAGLGIFETDLRLGVTQLSPEAAAMLGFPHERPIAASELTERIPAADRAVILARFGAAPNPGAANVEGRYLHPDGRVRWISWSGRRFFEDVGGTPVHVRTIGAVADVTERRRLQDLLSTQYAVAAALATAPTLSEATATVLRALCEEEGWATGELWQLAADGLLRCTETWHADDDALARFAAETRLTTFRFDQGLPGRVWSSGLPMCIRALEDDERFARRLAAREAGLKSAFALPVLVGDDCAGVLLFLSRTPIVIDDATIDGFLGIGRQIGTFLDRRRAELERERLRDELRQSQKLDALGRLSAGIAHDFNNLLTAVANNAVLAQSEPSPEARREMLDDVIAAARRGASLVERILAFARREAAHDKVVIDVREVVDESVRLLRAMIPPSVTLAVRHTASATRVLADAGALQQVIINLGTNAWHALDGRAGRVEIVLDDARVEGASEGDPLPIGRYVRICVTDTGRGIDPGTLARIFEPFFTTKEPGVGTGLGLAVVHGIVKSHGGAVRVRSALGAGTTVEILLPVSDDPVDRPSSPNEGASGLRITPFTSVAVLYVDDDEAMVRTAARTLRRMHATVTAVTSPFEALALVERDPTRFALVITDMNMPHLSGIDLLRDLRALAPTMRTILSSGFLGEVELRAADEIGVDALLHKPWDVTQLGETVARVLATSR